MDLLRPKPSEEVQLLEVYYRERWEETHLFQYEGRMPLKGGFTFMNSHKLRFHALYWSAVLWLTKHRP